MRIIYGKESDTLIAIINMKYKGRPTLTNKSRNSPSGFSLPRPSCSLFVGVGQCFSFCDLIYHQQMGNGIFSMEELLHFCRYNNTTTTKNQQQLKIEFHRLQSFPRQFRDNCEAVLESPTKDIFSELTKSLIAEKHKQKWFRTFFTTPLS